MLCRILSRGKFIPQLHTILNRSKHRSALAHGTGANNAPRYKIAEKVLNSLRSKPHISKIAELLFCSAPHDTRRNTGSLCFGASRLATLHLAEFVAKDTLSSAAPRTAPSYLTAPESIMLRLTLRYELAGRELTLPARQCTTAQRTLPELTMLSGTPHCAIRPASPLPSCIDRASDRPYRTTEASWEARRIQSAGTAAR